MSGVPISFRGSFMINRERLGRPPRSPPPPVCQSPRLTEPLPLVATRTTVLGAPGEPCWPEDSGKSGDSTHLPTSAEPRASRHLRLGR